MTPENSASSYLGTQYTCTSTALHWGNLGLCYQQYYYLCLCYQNHYRQDYCCKKRQVLKCITCKFITGVLLTIKCINLLITYYFNLLLHHKNPHQGLPLLQLLILNVATDTSATVKSYHHHKATPLANTPHFNTKHQYNIYKTYFATWSHLLGGLMFCLTALIPTGTAISTWGTFIGSWLRAQSNKTRGIGKHYVVNLSLRNMESLYLWEFDLIQFLPYSYIYLWYTGYKHRAYNLAHGSSTSAKKQLAKPWDSLIYWPHIHRHPFGENLRENKLK